MCAPGDRRHKKIVNPFAFSCLASTSRGGNMQVQQHDLDHEFPEYMRLIHELKDHQPELARLFTEYEEVNQQIVDIEENDKPFQDFEFENMKKRRLKLKDQIYIILRARNG
jgi:uncharacterized protein YdcH (DUF465 family)